MGKLDGKVAIVTGAGSGHGRAAAILFAREGARVVGAGRTIASGEETVRLVKEAGGEAVFVRADVSKTEDVKNLIKKTVDIYGRLDVLFNNAGVCPSWPIVKTREEDFDEVIAINLKGDFLTMKYGIPEMIKAGGGSIINTGSISAWVAGANTGAYCASKGGVVALSRAVAVECAANKIRVNTIEPGIIATPMSEKFYGNEEAAERIKAAIPLGRLGRPEEIAQVALFLACDDSSFISGTQVHVDGAHLARIAYPENTAVDRQR